MAEYTGNIALSNPEAGECNWDDDWHRNQFLKDVICRVLLSPSRVVEGGVVSESGPLQIAFTEGSAIQLEVNITWEAGTADLGLAPVGVPYLTHWIYLDENGLVTVSTTPPVGNYIPLAYVDTDQTEIVRVVDLRPMQTVTAAGGEVNKIIQGTSITDVILYDTKLDSDGGAWRYKTQLLSWYSEELNTATRGSRKEFPEVALIISHALGVTIYDATVPGVDMWMVFLISGSNSSGNANLIGPSSRVVLSVKIKNGVMATASNESYHACLNINFLSEVSTVFRANGSNVLPTNILGRNDQNLGIPTPFTGDPIVNNFLNDCDMTILDSAPIDPSTGIAVPTIAVATDGGVSVIDGPGGAGTVVNMTCGDVTKAQSSFVKFGEEGEIFYDFDTPDTRARYVRVSHDIPSVDTEISTNSTSKGLSDEFYVAGNSNVGTADLFFLAQAANPSLVIDSLGNIGTSEGLTLMNRDLVTPANGMMNYVAADYQSGWMVGDIKLATLASTSPGDIGVDTTTEHVTNGTFDTDMTGWTLDPGGNGSITVDGGRCRFDNDTDFSVTPRMAQQISTVVGQVYELKFDYDYTGGLAVFAEVGVNEFASEVLSMLITSTDSFTVTFKATSETMHINFRTTTTTAALFGHWDNISMKAIQTIIENGEFSTDRSWVLAENCTIPGDGSLFFNDTPADLQSGAPTNASVLTGEVCIMEYEIFDYVSGDVRVLARAGEGGAARFIGVDRVANGVYQEILKDGTNGGSTGYWNYIYFQNRATVGNYKIRNVTVRRMTELDRSLNDNPLQVVGQLTKTALGVDGSICSYSGFSANNELVQPENTGLDFGTGDFYIMGWFTLENIGKLQMFMGRWQSGSLYWDLYSDSDSLLKFRINGTSCAGTVSVKGNTWQFFTAVRVAGAMSIYLDGVLDPGAAATEAGSVNYTGSVLQIGSRPLSIGTQFPLDQGSIALVRTGAGAPSADQILDIYNSEKYLIQGLDASLSAGSNVTSLSYDPESETLKVGNDDTGGIFAVDSLVNGIKIADRPQVDTTLAIDHNRTTYAYAEADRVIFHKDEEN